MRSLLLCTLTILSTTVFAQKDLVKSQWSGQTIRIDGNDKEWKKPFTAIDEKSKIQYSVANDANNLYLCFQCPDQMNQIKIMRAGMKVALSTKGKPKFDASINFPLEQLNDPAPMGGGANSDSPRQRPDPKQMHDRFLAGSTFMNTAGFATRNGTLPIKDSSGLNVAMNWDSSNVLIYEIAIPLKELYGKNLATADLTKEINLAVEIYPIERPQRQGGDGGDNGGGFSGGRGRMGGGGGRMGGYGGGRGRGDWGGGNRPDRTALFEKTEFKNKLVLAKQ